MALNSDSKTGTAAGVPLPGGTETILVAEDSRSVREIIRTILEEAGYRVILAVDGEDALARFAESQSGIDLALLDVIMPKKNGKAVYDAMKKARPEIRVVFMSGYTHDIIGKSGILEDGIDLIMKPFKPAALLGKIRDVLDRASA